MTAKLAAVFMTSNVSGGKDALEKSFISRSSQSTP